MDSLASANAELWTELWLSLASLLGSYTAAHGLHGNREAAIEWDDVQITARHGEKWLNLRREFSRVAWMRENGSSGVLELTEAGRLRDAGAGSASEEEMDMVAESWARELMR